MINVGLGTFNLIPFPPLDGSNVLAELIPGVKQFFIRIRRYAKPILFVCLAVGILRKPLNVVNNTVLNWMWEAVRNLLNIPPFKAPVSYI